MRKYVQVRLEDFDVHRLRQAAAEGRLFVRPAAPTCCREEVAQKVRAYVARIHHLTTPTFRTSIDALWDDVFADEQLMELLMPMQQARKCRDFNKYGVVRLIGVLRVMGVYEQRNDYYYNNLLEPAGKDSNYRKYLSYGLEKRSLILKLRQLVNHYKHNFNI